MKMTITIEDPTFEVLHWLAGLYQNTDTAPEPEKAPPKPRKTSRATKAPSEPEKPSEAPSEPVPDLSALLDQAVAAATKLLESGQAAKVKAALGEVGAARVTELDDADKVSAFLAALGE